MAHKHSVYDTDTHFSINPITRALKNEASGKVSVIQFDHNSERFTFEIPRKVEDHDMSLCNVIQIHYINIDSQTKAKNVGAYEVDDMQISPEGDDVVILSWLISQNATQLVGSLNFLIRFACVTDGNVDYVWNTAIYSGISVSSGIYNGEAVVEEYADILEQWRQELIDTGGVTDDRIKAAVESYLAENPVKGGLTDTEKTLILTLFKNAAYISADMGAVLTQLETLWADTGSSDDSGGDTEATLSSISATYTGGDVAVGTAVSDLTGIVVTATYSDGSTQAVTGYTLSGTIAEGSNTILVIYGGKTTTFTVNGIVEESPAVNLMTTGELEIFSDLGIYTGYTGYYDADAKTLQLTARSGSTNVNAHLKITPFVEVGKTYTLFMGTENVKAVKVDYSATTAFATNYLSNTFGNGYVQFTVPSDAVTVHMVITTNEHIDTTITNVALYEGAYTEMQ